MKTQGRLQRKCRNERCAKWAHFSKGETIDHCPACGHAYGALSLGLDYAPKVGSPK